MRISAKGTIYVEGPAIVSKVSGKLIIAGAEFDRVIIPQHKGTSLRLPEESEIDIILLEGGSIKSSPARPRPEEWDQFLSNTERDSILVVGPVDSGKSFFTVLATNVLEANRILDTDVGQGVIAPPTMLGAAKVEDKIPFLSYLIAEKLYFVGSTSPSRFMGLFLSGVRKLYEELSGRIIIDTTGRITGEGARLKVAKAEMLGVDGVVLIEKYKGELSHIGKALKAKGIDYVTLPALEKVTERSRGERRSIRSKLYEKRLGGGEEIEISRDQLYGRDSEINYLLRYEGYRIPGISIGGKKFYDKDLEGVIVGLSKSGRDLGIGYIKYVRPDGIVIHSRIKDFDYARLSVIRVNPETFEDSRRIRFLAA